MNSARSIVATITYRLSAGETGAAVGGGTVPNCANHFHGSSIQWRSLNPDVAAVDDAGLITGLAKGLATIQGAYGSIVASHKLRIGP